MKPPFKCTLIISKNIKEHRNHREISFIWKAFKARNEVHHAGLQSIVLDKIKRFKFATNLLLVRNSFYYKCKSGDDQVDIDQFTIQIPYTKLELVPVPSINGDLTFVNLQPSDHPNLTKYYYYMEQHPYSHIKLSNSYAIFKSKL